MLPSTNNTKQYDETNCIFQEQSKSHDRIRRNAAYWCRNRLVRVGLQNGIAETVSGYAELHSVFSALHKFLRIILLTLILFYNYNYNYLQLIICSEIKAQNVIINLVKCTFIFYDESLDTVFSPRSV